MGDVYFDGFDLRIRADPFPVHRELWFETLPVFV